MLRFQDIERDFTITGDCEDDFCVRKPKNYKNRFNPFDLSDEDFYSRYRFDKITTRFLVNLLNIVEPKNNRGLPISTTLQVLTTLRFLGRNVHQSDIGDLHGLSQPTVSRIIKNVCKKIALLLPKFVKFHSNSELRDVKTKFYQLAQFPNVIGAIDCTHVRIKCPAKVVGRESAGFYLNRKGFYSLNVQIVCDADCKIVDIVARSRGSRHDSRIWADCALKAKLDVSKSVHNGVLLGDAGYLLSPILLTPVRCPSSTKEERYNKSHIATRSKVECLNGQLKSKFRSIFERLRVDLDTAKNIVVAVAVLHNIAKERKSSFLDAPFHSPVRQESHTLDLDTNQATNGINSGKVYRTAFINAHF